MDIERFTAWLRDQSYSPNTIVDYILVLKRFFKFARHGNVDTETPFPDEVLWLKKSIKPNELREAEFITSAEVRDMIRIADRLRDKVMLSVGFEAGLRASELLNLDIDSVMLDDGVLNDSVFASSLAARRTLAKQ